MWDQREKRWKRKACDGNYLNICEYSSFAYKAHKWVDPWTQGELLGKVVASDAIWEILCAIVEHNLQSQVSNARQGQHSTLKAKQDRGSQQDVDLKWTLVEQGQSLEPTLAQGDLSKTRQAPTKTRQAFKNAGSSDSPCLNITDHSTVKYHRGDALWKQLPIDAPSETKFSLRLVYAIQLRLLKRYTLQCSCT